MRSQRVVGETASAKLAARDVFAGDMSTRERPAIDRIDGRRPALPSRQIDALLEQGRYAEVLAIADAAIQALLHDGVTIDDFVRLSLRGASLESLVRVERRAVMRFRRLHEPIALRWEVLRRWGRAEEASQMRLLCIRHFPERASVWATAGNQSLDEQRYDDAQACFERCLRCNPRWTAALAGLAIVHETRKDWVRALEYRGQVVQNERALQRDDAPSLQRVIRYAAALARTGRWQEAGVLFRHGVEHGAFERLPAERPVLARVFSRELYAPAIVATMTISETAVTPEIALARREAEAIAAAARAILGDATLDSTARLTQLGVCAWLSGDEARAYALLDEAELGAPEDLTIQCLLPWAAATIGAEDRATLRRYALEHAHAYLASAAAGPVSEYDLCCAAITLARWGECAAAVSALRSAPASAASALEPCAQALARGPDAPIPELPVRPGEDLRTRLQRVMLFRAAHRAAGRSALAVALASTGALEPPAVTAGP